jgi:hypothetical protein
MHRPKRTGIYGAAYDDSLGDEMRVTVGYGSVALACVARRLQGRCCAPAPTTCRQCANREHAVAVWRNPAGLQFHGCAHVSAPTAPRLRCCGRAGAGWHGRFRDSGFAYRRIPSGVRGALRLHPSRSIARRSRLRSPAAGASSLFRDATAHAPEVMLE